MRTDDVAPYGLTQTGQSRRQVGLAIEYDDIAIDCAYGADVIVADAVIPEINQSSSCCRRSVL